MTNKYKEYLLSDEWAAIRNDLYTVRGRNCERCGSDKNLQVHHKNYKNIFHEEPSDLEILCNGCHFKEHGLDKKAKKVKMSKRFIPTLRKKKRERKKKKPKIKKPHFKYSRSSRSDLAKAYYKRH